MWAVSDCTFNLLGFLCIFESTVFNTAGSFRQSCRFLLSCVDYYIIIKKEAKSEQKDKHEKLQTSTLRKRVQIFQNIQQQAEEEQGGWGKVSHEVTVAPYPPPPLRRPPGERGSEKGWQRKAGFSLSSCLCHFGRNSVRVALFTHTHTHTHTHGHTHTHTHT